MRDHDRRVEADDDDIAQAPPGCPGRRDLAVPGRDQIPDMLLVLALALLTLASAAASHPDSARHTVESDATGPNRSP